MDIMVAICLLTLSLPFFVGLVLLLAIVNQGTPFFTQIRPGRHLAPFKVIKFKTMKVAFDNSGQLLPDEQRLTRIGKWIRSTSLDEIPQLLNVLVGHMSLVGPRPLLMEYIPLYTKDQIRRHNVRPGITGWAQINGRNAISWNQKFVYDCWYVDNFSFGLDIRVLATTLVKVFKAEGITGKGVVTAEKFNGFN